MTLKEPLNTPDVRQKTEETIRVVTAYRNYLKATYEETERYLAFLLGTKPESDYSRRFSKMVPKKAIIACLQEAGHKMKRDELVKMVIDGGGGPKRDPVKNVNQAINMLVNPRSNPLAKTAKPTLIALPGEYIDLAERQI